MASSSTKKSKKKKTSVSSDLETSGFSPVGTPKESRHGNLTGNARIVKDIVADWHNSIQKWNTHNVTGVELVNRIANSKLEHILGQDDETTINDGMPVDMMELLETLEKIFQKMEKIIKKMDSMTSSLRGVSALVNHQSHDSDTIDCLFQTWPAGTFYETSKELLDMFKQEIRVKRTIVENIAHVNQRQLMMFNTATWLHQPYIEDKSHILLESMLLETGHR